MIPKNTKPGTVVYVADDWDASTIKDVVVKYDRTQKGFILKSSSYNEMYAVSAEHIYLDKAAAKIAALEDAVTRLTASIHAHKEGIADITADLEVRTYELEKLYNKVRKAGKKAKNS